MPGATIVIVTTYKDTKCIVVYKEYRRWAPNGFWSTPGGTIDEGETPLDAAIRETKEEAYITLTPEQLSPPLPGKNCTYYITYIPYVSKKDFLTKRYQSPNLKETEKEMWSLTFVPIYNLRSNTNNVHDIHGKDVNLRDIFFADLKRFPEILEKIESY